MEKERKNGGVEINTLGEQFQFIRNVSGSTKRGLLYSHVRDGVYHFTTVDSNC